MVCVVVEFVIARPAASLLPSCVCWLSDLAVA